MIGEVLQEERIFKWSSARCFGRGEVKKLKIRNWRDSTRV